MKVAIPLYKERVSPHFGSSSKIFLVDIQGAAVRQEVIWDVGGESAMEIARRLVDLGVEKVICGGIQYHYKHWLIRKGVAVVDNQRGMAKEVIQDLLRSKV